MDISTIFDLQHAYWFWIGLGCLLLAAEMLGASGYLLWAGLAAILLGSILWLLPVEISPAAQAIIYSLVLILNTYFWWRWLKTRANKRPDTIKLNERSAQLIGKRALLIEDVQFGISRAKIGDSSWRVKCDEDLKAGNEVMIKGIDGATLIVGSLKDS